MKIAALLAFTCCFVGIGAPPPEGKSTGKQFPTGGGAGGNSLGNLLLLQALSGGGGGGGFGGGGFGGIAALAALSGQNGLNSFGLNGQTQAGALDPTAISSVYTDNVISNTPGAVLSDSSKANQLILKKGFLMGMATGVTIVEGRPFVINSGGAVITTFALCDNLNRVFDSGDGRFMGIILEKIDPTHTDLVDFFEGSGFVHGPTAETLASNILKLLKIIVTSFSKNMARKMISGCGVGRNGGGFVLLMSGEVIHSYAKIANYGPSSLMAMDVVTQFPIGIIKTISQNALKASTFSGAVKRIPKLASKIGNVAGSLANGGFLNLQTIQQASLAAAFQNQAFGGSGFYQGLQPPRSFGYPNQFSGFNSFASSGRYNRNYPTGYPSYPGFPSYPTSSNYYPSSYNQNSRYSSGGNRGRSAYSYTGYPTQQGRYN